MSFVFTAHTDNFCHLIYKNSVFPSLFTVCMMTACYLFSVYIVFVVYLQPSAEGNKWRALLQQLTL